MINLFNKKKLLTNEIQSLDYLTKTPLNNIISSFEELGKLLNFLKDIKSNVPENIYHNIHNFHSILYKDEETIKIDSYNIKISLSNLFYLNLLIMDNPETVNYKYSFDFINNIHDSNKDSKKIKKILFSKILLVLLKNYEGLEEYDEDKDKEKVDELRQENEKIINDNIDDLKIIDSSFTDENIKNEKLDELYINIIGKLITSKKLEDDIMNQLDMENINLSLKMFEKLSETLNESNLKDYIISKKEDLLEEKTINFYNILFKYVLKNAFFVYLNDFLFKTRKIILKIIQKKELILSKIKNEKLIYILKFLLDIRYKYYYDKYSNNYEDQINEVLTYYKGYFFETKKKDIDKIESMNKNEKSEELKIYLDDYNVAKSKNIDLGFINYLFNTYFKEEKTEKNFNLMVEKWEVMKKIINDKKRKKMRADDCLVLIKYFNDINNKESLCKIFNEESRIFLSDYLNTKIGKYINSDYSCSIPYYIMNKSTFEFHINEKGKEPYIVYEKIIYGFFNFEIKYDELKLIKEKEDFKKSEDKLLIDNFNKFFDFFKQVEDELKEKFKYNYKLRISLDFQMEKKKNNNNDYNITCIYTFSDPIKNEQLKFKEGNIFVNGTKSDEFKNLLSAINNESFKELKYQ